MLDIILGSLIVQDASGSTVFSIPLIHLQFTADSIHVLGICHACIPNLH